MPTATGWCARCIGRAFHRLSSRVYRGQEVLDRDQKARAAPSRQLSLAVFVCARLDEVACAAGQVSDVRQYEMREETTMIFTKMGKAGTEETARIAIQTAKERGIRHIVIASSTGYTAQYF